MLLVRNLASHNAVPEDVLVGVDGLTEILDEVLSEIAKGKRL